MNNINHVINNLVNAVKAVEYATTLKDARAAYLTLCAHMSAAQAASTLGFPAEVQVYCQRLIRATVALSASVGIALDVSRHGNLADSVMSHAIDRIDAEFRFSGDDGEDD
jgi:hypothetical protein